MGQFGRLARIADLPGKRELAGYIQGMKLIESGAGRMPAGDARPVEMPADLMAALA